MNGRVLVIVFMIVAVSFCVIPVSATWIDKGVQTSAAINGNMVSTYLNVTQQAHYYYEDNTGQWKADLTVTSEVYRYNGTSKKWEGAPGTFGIYTTVETVEENDKSEVYGDQTIWYENTIRPKFTSNGAQTLYSGTVYNSRSIGTNAYAGIVVIGQLDNYHAVSTTIFKK